MTDIKSFNISLSHSNVHLDLNNPKDSGNIQHTLSLLFDTKDDKTKTILILRKTSMKYLERLQEDGLIADNGGPDIVPVFDPFITNKGVDFFNAGGYKKLFEVNNLPDPQKSQVTISADNLHIGDNFGTYSQRLDSRLKKKSVVNAPATNENKQSAIIKIISKYWWALLIPVIIGIVLLLIEYNFFH